ncbi:hypothetical protein HK101_010605 [Irineochytrium annulatum]|nr:hypothetical protein HK101_010605 [Irineochytrium annulatum]
MPPSAGGRYHYPGPSSGYPHYPSQQPPSQHLPPYAYMQRSGYAPPGSAPGPGSAHHPPARGFDPRHYGTHPGYYGSYGPHSSAFPVAPAADAGAQDPNYSSSSQELQYAKPRYGGLPTSGSMQPHRKIVDVEEKQSESDGQEVILVSSVRVSPEVTVIPSVHASPCMPRPEKQVDRRDAAPPAQADNTNEHSSSSTIGTLPYTARNDAELKRKRSDVVKNVTRDDDDYDLRTTSSQSADSKRQQQRELDSPPTQQPYKRMTRANALLMAAAQAAQAAALKTPSPLPAPAQPKQQQSQYQPVPTRAISESPTLRASRLYTLGLVSLKSDAFSRLPQVADASSVGCHAAARSLLLSVYMGDNAAKTVALWLRSRREALSCENPILDDRRGDTLVHWCARLGRGKTLAALLACAGQIRQLANARQRGAGGESAASSFAHELADVRGARNKRGETPLMVAVAGYHCYLGRCLPLMLESLTASDLLETDERGWTVLDHARRPIWDELDGDVDGGGVLPPPVQMIGPEVKEHARRYYVSTVEAFIAARGLKRLGSESGSL